MRRPWYLWLSFTLCLAVVLAAMGWISLTALRVGRRAAWEENVRLALWRIDTNLAPLISQESARPYFCYRSFLPIDRTYAEMLNKREGDDVLIPSPLLAEKPPHVRVYFQFEPDGQFTSPQVPVGTNRDLAVPRHVSNQTVFSNSTELVKIEPLLDRDKLLAKLPERILDPVDVVIWPLAQTPEQRDANREMQFALQQQGQRSVAERRQREQAFIGNANTALAQNDMNWYNPFLLPGTDVSGVLMTPLWIDGQLILARRIVVRGQVYVQGCVLDWPGIRTSLLETIEDLLPEADLAPVTTSPDEEDPCVLAALPVRLEPGPPATLAVASSSEDFGGGFLSSIRLSLGIAWACVLLAAAAVSGLLWGVLRLSERRASFVTAVTHELRTPLTTFQMYAEMLSEDMVTEPQQRRQYLNTLRAESGRLVHLVENVLSYARLERGRTGGPLESIPLGELIDPMIERLSARAEQAGMELIVQRSGPTAEMVVRANVSATEQVLFNLVDNSCKYAAGATDKRIHLVLDGQDGPGRLAIRDHGPGVSPPVRRRLFRSFSKSAPEAAQTAPGVGLGLALSRRLARGMGGDLTLDEKNSEGARFVLTLAAVESTETRTAGV